MKNEIITGQVIIQEIRSDHQQNYNSNTVCSNKVFRYIVLRFNRKRNRHLGWYQTYINVLKNEIIQKNNVSGRGLKLWSNMCFVRNLLIFSNLCPLINRFNQLEFFKGHLTRFLGDFNAKTQEFFLLRTSQSEFLKGAN